MVTILASSPELNWFSQQHSILANMSGSFGHGMPPTGSYPPKSRSKMDVCSAFIEKLQSRRNLDLTPALLDGIEQHFRLLPSRYALDVNISSLDVLNHKRLLDSARADPSAVSFQVRPVDIVSAANNKAAMDRRPSFGNAESLLEAATSSYPRSGLPLPRPAFGSSPNLQALLQQEADEHNQNLLETPFYEVTIASVDQQKLLSRLSEALGDLNLNICEAHAFNTHDRFSLDVFVVNGWHGEDTQELEEVLSERLQQLPQPLSGRGSEAALSPMEQNEELFTLDAEQRQELTDRQTSLAQSAAARSGGEASPSDDWELDPGEIEFLEKIASGAFGDLYRGVYCGQEIAIKILRNVQDDTQQYQEFLQEVAIMRKVRHKNVVQFIGACTRKPNLCIVFEYMPCGSMYDYLRKGQPLKLSALLKVAVDVCRGMDYLHKKKIIHRDLKAANLLTDETGAVKIADFGVARMLETTGIMTAETGTYRWMAPEVIEHNPYGEKADVFSFGIVLWELLTGKVPYQEMTPLQAAVGVVQKGLRPIIPAECPAPLADIMRQCWAKNPRDRPGFDSLKTAMEELYQAAKDEEQRKTASQGLLTKLRKNFK